MSTATPGARAALELVEDGQTIGLGTGRAAEAFVDALGERVRDGLSVRGVPTSERTAALAASLDIPLLTLAEAFEEMDALDATFDGADEVDPKLDLIKGYGAALVREKIVAASSARLVVLVGPEKRVDTIGARGRLPVEVLPFGLSLCTTRLAALGCEPTLRSGDAGPLITDNGNHILDLAIAPLDDAAAFHTTVRAIPGVVDTGLFLGMADTVIISDESTVEVLQRDR